ncbi:MAG: leucine-rich repeat domain-containing protein [Dysgonamonadaceae bacterium]|nr:leucine-rich repeat domain-containing protein [Dysgonamonadaceae bacterium]MDD4728965.1 leucine-rich repeat domain-containing protein [Dysgonamonadaceae bacterium]
MIHSLLAGLPFFVCFFWLILLIGHCRGFTCSLAFPPLLKKIGDAAFYSCAGFTELVVGNSIVNIDTDAFRFCKNISGSIVFPITLTTIGEYSFWGCVKVNSIRFSNPTPFAYSNYMLPTSATIEVPADAVATYKATYGWGGLTIVGY